MQAHVAHRAGVYGDGAYDNVCQWGSLAIKYLANSHEPSKAKFIAAGAEQLLRSIRADAGTSAQTKEWAGDALEALGLQL